MHAARRAPETAGRRPSPHRGASREDPVLPQQVRRVEGDAGVDSVCRRPQAPAVHDQAGFAQRVSVRLLRGAARRAGADSRLERNHRQADLRRLHPARPRPLVAALRALPGGGGADADQLVQVSFGYGLFTGGFGLHAGIERVGAAVLPASSGNTQRQILRWRTPASTR